MDALPPLSRHEVALGTGSSVMLFIDWEMLAWRSAERRKVFAVRCSVMRCDAMRCDAMQCDALRCGVSLWRGSGPLLRQQEGPKGRIASLHCSLVMFGNVIEARHGKAKSIAVRCSVMRVM